MAKLTVTLTESGRITLPKALRHQHCWHTGQQFTNIDLDGVIIISPGESKVNVLADQLRNHLLDGGATLEEMLTQLQELRARRNMG